MLLSLCRPTVLLYSPLYGDSLQRSSLCDTKIVVSRAVLSISLTTFNLPCLFVISVASRLYYLRIYTNIRSLHRQVKSSYSDRIYRLSIASQYGAQETHTCFKYSVICSSIWLFSFFYIAEWAGFSLSCAAVMKSNVEKLIVKNRRCWRTTLNMMLY